MIFEDAHRIDPTSLEVLSRVVDRIRTLSVFLVVTHRPEFTPQWIGQPHVTSLNINRLARREIAGCSNEPKLSKFVHKETHAGPGRSIVSAKSSRLTFAMNRFAALLAKICQKQKSPRETLLAGIEQLIDQVLLDTTVAS